MATPACVRGQTAAQHDLLNEAADSGAGPDSLRQAYFLLQGRALAPGLRRFALAYVGAWMRDAQRRAKQRRDSLPNNWPSEGLHTWLADQHDQADHGFQENAGAELPGREAVIDSTLQLAPLLCIDGAWLQGYTDIQYASAPVTCALFAIYWDELGNGQYALNHPKIYRDLLHEMDVDLAPTGSHAFAHDPRLRDDAFRLPVLWLCLGKLPSTFLAEILGLNLAMELSGVGGGYRSAHRFLAQHGFSTHFVDLHNTIDNVATGHSGKAAEAVDHYMRAQAQDGDATLVAAQWVRIRTGYNALTSYPSKTASWWLKHRLAWRARGNPSAMAVPLHHDWFAAPAGAHALSAA